MTLERRISDVFGLDEEGWARHANPWSGWTRIATMPVLILAIWSRAWLGWWALLPVAACLLWIYLNPRLFSPARSDAAWASKAVFGERLWTRRDRQPVPVHHRAVPKLLNGVSAVGALVLVYGLVLLEPTSTLVGAILAYVSKLWFLDRMVWLYHDVVRDDPSQRYSAP